MLRASFWVVEIVHMPEPAEQRAEIDDARCLASPRSVLTGSRRATRTATSTGAAAEAIRCVSVIDRGCSGGEAVHPAHGRLAKNRTGPTGQDSVKNSEQGRRLAGNREGPTGQGRVKQTENDRRLAGNRGAPTG